MSTTIRLQLPTLHNQQQRIKREAKRFNVVCCGRRFGKSLMGEDLAISPALEGYPVGWFSPNYKFLMEVWRDLVRLLQPVTTRVNSTEHRIELMTGGVIEAWSLDNQDAGRSRKYKRVIIDEAAMVPHLGHIWNEAISATLADYKGDAFFLSTPKGRNFFWESWLLGQDAESTEWKSWQMPTSANPFIALSEIEAQRQRLPERVFLQEWSAQFLEDAGGVFRQVMGAATATAQAQAERGHQYVIGVDWGRHNDYTVLTVIDVKTKEVVYFDRFNQIEYSTQSARLNVVCEKFRPDAIIAEANSIGEPIIERLRSDYNLPVRSFTTTNATKAQIIDALALAFERSDLQILDEPILIAELQAYEMERLPSGLIRYSAPSGLHDDCVMSLALAWYGANQSGGEVYSF